MVSLLLYFRHNYPKALGVVNDFFLEKFFARITDVSQYHNNSNIFTINRFRFDVRSSNQYLVIMENWIISVNWHLKSAEITCERFTTCFTYVTMKL